MKKSVCQILIGNEYGTGFFLVVVSEGNKIIVVSEGNKIKKGLFAAFLVFRALCPKNMKIFLYNKKKSMIL